MTTAIQTENLVKTFRRVHALNGLNLRVPEGSIYALVGPNGAGKTTALKILMNILEPTSGRARIFGTDSTLLEGKLFTTIGYVSENQELPSWMSVGSFLEYLRLFYPRWDQDLEKELVKKLDLPLERKLRHLSRGMRMKAALASVLAYHPKLVVLDEPFSGLDPLVRDELIESMLERAEEATVLISSHDLGEIESFASHIGYLDEGTLVFSDEMSELANRYREIELTLESPSGLPGELPESWMEISCSSTGIRFIESNFDEERTRAEIEKIFGKHRNLTFTPMSLRSIFLATAKAGRGSKEKQEA